MADFHIDYTEVRDGILDHQVEACPTCDSKLFEGFGLAGGGYGAYGMCEPCGKIVWKCISDDE